ncbi:AcrB/AcrD/AcrF family protein, partial [Candidatus Marinamargulisbacteria bacterium SCGC AAA071-K20]
ASSIRAAYEGLIASTVRYQGDEVDFRVSLTDRKKTSVDTLTELTVPNNKNKLIRVGQFAQVETLEDVLVINHYDGDRSVTIYGEVDTALNTSAKINSKLKETFAPIVKAYPDMRMEFGGEEKDTEEAMQSLAVAFVLALIGIYFTLVILFNSFSQPFLVMSAIPFTFTGIVFAFYLRDMAFGFVAIIGLIGLTGIVVNNSLIMISFMNTIRDREGVSIDSIAKAAKQRLRPIILTTLTTAAGLFPTAYGFGGNNAFLVPMINAIAWGLVFASIITLFLVPSLYIVHHSIRLKLKGSASWITGSSH